MLQGILLSLTIWVPIAFGIAVLAIGNDRNPMPARWTALVGSVLGFLVTLPLWFGFQPTADMQFTEAHAWIPRFSVNWRPPTPGWEMFKAEVSADPVWATLKTGFRIT